MVGKIDNTFYHHINASTEFFKLAVSSYRHNSVKIPIGDGSKIFDDIVYAVYHLALNEIIKEENNCCLDKQKVR